VSSSPRARREGRRLDTLTSLLAALAGRRPRLAFRLASALGRSRNRLTRRWPSAGEVASLFPFLQPAEAAKVAAAIGALEERSEVFVRSARRGGIEAMRPLVVIPDALRTIHGPAILATFHIGAVQTLGVALEELGRPVLAFREGRPLFTPRRLLEVHPVRGHDQQRAAAFARALGQLRGGGLVLMALDSVPGTALVTECLGRLLALARGPFALARMTGAPIVPLTSRWIGAGVQLIVDGPLVGIPADDSGTFEQSLAQSASRWLEGYLRRWPSELGLGLLRELLYGVSRPATGSALQSADPPRRPADPPRQGAD